jgi:hypothetical protein
MFPQLLEKFIAGRFNQILLSYIIKLLANLAITRIVSSCNCSNCIDNIIIEYSYSDNCDNQVWTRSMNLLWLATP